MSISQNNLISVNAAQDFVFLELFLRTQMNCPFAQIITMLYKIYMLKVSYFFDAVHYTVFKHVLVESAHRKNEREE